MATHIQVTCKHCGHYWGVTWAQTTAKARWRWAARTADITMMNMPDAAGRVDTDATLMRWAQARRDDPAGRQVCPRCGSTETESWIPDKDVGRITDDRIPFEEQIEQLFEEQIQPQLEDEEQQIKEVRVGIRQMREQMPDLSEKQIRDAVRGLWPENILVRAFVREYPPG